MGASNHTGMKWPYNIFCAAFVFYSITLFPLNTKINQQELNLHSQLASRKYTSCSNTVTIETTYFFGLPCWMWAQAMVFQPTGLAWSSRGQWRSSKCPWITVKKCAVACREYQTATQNKRFRKKSAEALGTVPLCDYFLITDLKNI